jgi:hypothetical protein
METITSTTVIYNRLNYDAVIAAAIVKKNAEDVTVIDISQDIPEGCDKYIWLGVEPSYHNGSFMKRHLMKEHIVITDNGDGGTVATISETGSKKSLVIKTSKEDEDTLAVKRTLIDRVCEQFALFNEEYVKISFHVSRFHNKDTEIEYLALVYTNIVEADKCLSGHGDYSVKNCTSSDIERYMTDIRTAKFAFNKNYRKAVVKTDNGFPMAIHTTMNDFGYHLALRLIKLVHTYFLNITVGLNGVQAYTNVSGLQLDQFVSDHRLLN